MLKDPNHPGVPGGIDTSSKNRDLKSYTSSRIPTSPSRTLQKILEAQI
jgi:hypothetical protein